MPVINKLALITRKIGKDVNYLFESLLEKAYKLYGLKRCSIPFNSSRIDNLYRDLYENIARFSTKSICSIIRGFNI